METGKYVTKTTNYAADVFPQAAEYAHSKPSDLLKVVMQAEQEAGSLDFSQDMTERLLRFMPDQLVGMKANKKGALEFSLFKKADFLSPTGAAGTTVKGSGIVDVLVSDVVVEGAQPFMSARKVLETWRISSGAEQIPFFTTRKAAKAIAPNADAADLAESIGKVLAVPQEYKLKCTLDKGLLADASVDIKAAAIREMGAAMEIALDDEAVDVCINNAYTTATQCAEADALKGLNLARGQIGVNGFRATGALINPMFEANALNSMAVPAYNDRAQEIGLDASLLKFAGLELGVDGSTSLDWGSASDVGAIVVDKSHAAHVIVREDLALSDYDAVTKYAIEPTVVSRFVTVAPVESKKNDNKGAMVKVTQSS